MKLITVIGARPNMMKIDPELKQEILHSGQHWSSEMSDNFLSEFNLPKPKWNLGLRSEETGKMMDKMRKIFKKEKPNMVIVFGDTNSALAGALAAAYEFVPIAHIEAGLRSFNREMPEEINRAVIDRVATLRFCPNNYSAINLLKEGIKDGVHVVGDPSFDAFGRFLPIKKKKNWRKYILLTLHRNFNADNKQVLRDIFDTLKESKEKTIFPVHPRTAKAISEFKLKVPKNIKIISPTSYGKMLELISNAKKVITDSGGVQKEAFWMSVPVLILRTETEWLDVVSQGGGMLVGHNKSELLRGIKEFGGKMNALPEFGANKRIREIIYKHI